MAEDAELVGGISVSIGASHAQLASDIAEAERMLAALQAREITIPIRARYAAPAGEPGTPATTRATAGATAATATAAAATGSPAAAAVPLESRALEAKIEALIAALGRAPIGRAPTRGRTGDEEIEASIAQYPAHMQPQIREALGRPAAPSALPGETQPMQSFRPQAETAEIEQASAKVGDFRESVGQPVAVNIDNTEALAAVRELTAAITALREAVAQPLAITAAATPATGPAAAAPPPVVGPAPAEEPVPPEVPVPAHVAPAVTPVTPVTTRPTAPARRPRAVAAAAATRQEPEEEQELPQEVAPANRGGRVGILRQPAIAEYQGGPFGNQGGPIQYVREPTAAPAINIQRNLTVAISPQQRAAEAAQREDARQKREDARQEREQARAQAANDRAAVAVQAEAVRQRREAVLAAPPPNVGNVSGPSELPGFAAPPATPESRARDETQRRAALTTLPQRTDVERAARDARDRATAERFNRPGPTAEERAARTVAERQNVTQGARAERERIAFEQRQQRTLFQRQVREAQIERAQQAAQAAQEAQVTAAGRTARTTASGLGSFFAGPRREQIEAQTSLAAAQRETGNATRYRLVFENEITRNSVKAQYATREEARALRDRNKEIAASPEYAEAKKNQEDAIAREGQAIQRVEKLSSGFGTAARTLLSVTAGGAAFGVGLKAVDTVLAAVTPALENFIDIQTGFGATSTRVTTALGAQTIAMKGNVNAVLAAAEAQAGLSASASDAIDSQLRLTTQIKAGAQAQQQASDLFRAAAGVGNAPSGLFGGYGGIGGTGLFAQQLGGGRGLTETVAQDIGAFRGNRGPDLLGNLNQGLAYVTNPDVRQTVNQQAKQQNNPIFDVLGGLGRSNPLTQPINSIADLLGVNNKPPATQGAQGAQNQFAQAPTQSQTAYINNLNDAAKRGAEALGSASTATYKLATSADEVSRGAAAAAAAGDVYGVSLAQQQHLVVALGGAVAKSGDDYTKAIEQFAVGISIPAPETLAKGATAQERQREIESAASVGALQAQQQFGRAAFFGNLTRTTQTQQNVQLPAQAYLQNLAAPPTPAGTGLVAANGREQRRINSDIKETQQLQDQLNTYYKQGQQVIENTYKPAIIQTFGAAAGQVFSGLLGQIETTGKAIAGIQASISNEQAAYAVAQYNFQLFIAKRTLSDIGGLTDHNFGAGESYLGVLERQNLLLGRQAQMLQFSLSQRQINFQTAIAGFQVPGLTPAEQNARVQEAKTEASYAQKQLDIQRQMFGNQVKIVDITNLRQGADLVKQISLLQQGRRVTIDTAAAQQKLERLSKLQQQLVARAGTYIDAVNQEIAKANADMTAIESATGRAIGQLEKRAAAALYHVGYAFFAGINAGIGAMAGAYNTPGAGGGANDARKPHASGTVFNTQGATALGPYGVAGEAGGETVAILAHPKMLMDGGQGGGGGNLTVNFYGGITVKSETDIDTLVRKITQAQGRSAALKGLRTPN